MHMIEIIIVPAANGRFRAILDRRELIVSAREPFFASARKLLAEGVDPEMVLTMRHQGSQTRSLTMTVGKAAGLMVDDRDAHGPPNIIRWREAPSTRAGHSIEKNEETLPQQRAAE